ncbi:MAG: hypothetical protein A3H28_02965 [Acidobacteria bacterium RIFCSPLOWO2_02_FULL_61_28]|nr:MAG: hypothetical protein A3H28_02965 [Acidobacteria bacterium RIFCSPLOWO2_02_FULL_61_28]
MPMRITKLLVVTLVFVATLPAFGQRQFDDVEYLKPAGSSEKKGQTVKGFLRFDNKEKELQFVGKATNFTVKYERVKNLIYERTARPRYVSGILLAWPLLFTKGKKHFLTVQYADDTGAGQFATVRLEKGNYQEILVTAEAETGIKVERHAEN